MLGKGLTNRGISSKGAKPLRNGLSNRRTVVVYAKHRERRVVVTGMGVVSCFGTELDSFYNSLLEGKSGISNIEGFDTSNYSTKIAGEIKHLDAHGYLPKKFEKRVDKVIKYIMVAGKKALENANLGEHSEDIKHLDHKRAGILMSTAMGGMATFSAAVDASAFQGVRKINPFCIPFSINNMGGGMLAMDTGFMGPNYSVSTACASGNYSIRNAAEHIRRGEVDVMVAGSADAAIIPIGIGGFIACQAMSSRNDSPETASRPWDKGRDGFVMGEGAGALVLEEYEHAKRRGARIYAEYAGGAYTCDAYHMTNPDPEGRGVKLCLTKALENANLTAGEVDYVNAHGTSTPAGDMAEYRALNAIFPQEHLRINSTKSAIGHLLGGSGAVEAIATLCAMETGYVHPTLNLVDPDDGVDPIRCVAGKKQKLDVRVGVSNSFGFGGHNSSIIFKKMEN